MKREILLFFLLMNSTVPGSVLYATDNACVESTTAEQQALFLELQEDDPISRAEEEMFESIDQTPQEPSVLWTWFCMAGSTIIVNYIYAKRYFARKLERIRLFWRYHMLHEKKK